MRRPREHGGLLRLDVFVVYFLFIIFCYYYCLFIIIIVCPYWYEYDVDGGYAWHVLYCV